MKKLLTFIFLLHLSQSFAQDTPPLERVITVKFTNEKLDKALKMISDAGSFSFSYNPDDFDINRRVSVSVQNQPVREALNAVFGNTATFKNKGNYIILKRNIEEPKKDFFVMGYVSDGETGLKIEKASVYEPVTLASAVTNQYGYYRLKIPATLQNVNLQVRKQNYRHEEVAVKAKTDATVNVSLLPSKPIQVAARKTLPVIYRDTLPAKKLDSLPKVAVLPPVIEEPTITSTSKKPIDYDEYWAETKDALKDAHKKLTDWLITARQNIHLNNIEDTLYRQSQVSILPFIGTNHYMSGNVINDYSFNIIAGYSLGVRKLEIGGVLNMVRGRVDGIQAAGFANLVAGKLNGVQAAGTVNVVGQSAYGVQGAGFANVVLRNFSGVQGSGFVNFVGNNTRNSVQAAGFANAIVKSGSGVQAAGFVNLVGGSFKGVQASGFLNQVSDVFSGVQAGILNMAYRVDNGLQVGVMNVAEESNSIPVGLISFVKRGGYKRLELSTDEVSPGNLTFKTGVRRLYNIFTVGYGFDQPGKPVLSLGYGLGTAWKLNKTLWLNFDVISSHLQNDVEEWETNNLLRGSLGLEVHLSPRIALFAAPTINFHATQQPEVNLGNMSRFKFYEKQGRYFGERVNLASWMGYQAGIRICNI
ncbi:STN and carboxypeptidase regulatory-like domain-containing protein [Emticicia sp. TH156]|uniref:STN and carboxypeptidase regulatory-like domain-containing protein n=1 Tax=Emticicia sp. TH156 TaxID=2067454 RepID=UPI000C78DA17|nr:STN and carboxypeptidase regulatory-like domain-containing protein [Emticicia sp. TH156]PLK44592.1 hypothetical protein C0V77_08985 [Emticicia sp. TH156]